jgi:hypothetical protein
MPRQRDVHLCVHLYGFGSHRPRRFKELLDVENLKQGDRHERSSLEERPLDHALVRAFARWTRYRYVPDAADADAAVAVVALVNTLSSTATRGARRHS